MSNSIFTCVATIGPESGSSQAIKELRSAGMTSGRLNMSHGTHQSHQEYINLLKKNNVATILDLSGPRTNSKNTHTFDPKLPAFTDKDRYDLAFGHKAQVDWVALSYVKNHKDIDILKENIQELGMNSKVMSKIEHQTAVDNLEEIIAASDAILIGRGDLGSSIGLENLARTTLKIIATCREKHIPVIVGTEILYSMIQKDTPTRAEATDAWLHGYAGASGIMLSNETAVGKHPEKAVQWASALFSAGQKDRLAGHRLL